MCASTTATINFPCVGKSRSISNTQPCLHGFARKPEEGTRPTSACISVPVCAQVPMSVSTQLRGSIQIVYGYS